MAEFNKDGKYTSKTGKVYDIEKEKALAQKYAQNALEGTSGIYVPASQEYNALYNAGYLPSVEPVKENVNSGAYSAYASAVDRQNNLLREQQALAEKQRRAAMEATINANNQAADKSLREAYIANMLAKRNMSQQLKAMGVSGGATETTLADIQNTYMNNRFGIEENRNDANQQARQAYDNGVAGDYSNYLAKAYELKGNMVEKAGKAENTGTASESVDGYKIDSLGINVPSGSKESVVSGLRSALIARGWTEAQIAEYLMNNGIIG